jgi:hypothetical protein
MMTAATMRMWLLHGEIRFGSPLTPPIFLAPPVLVHMHLLAQRIITVLLRIPYSRWSLLRPLLDSLKVATRVHDACGRHVRTILWIPFVRDRRDIYGAHETLAHLINAVVDVDRVYIGRFWLAIVGGVPVDLLAHFVLQQYPQWEIMEMEQRMERTKQCS